MTTVAVSHNAQPVYIRIIDIGGNTISDGIARELDIDYEYAEKLKLETLNMSPKLLNRPVANTGIFADDEEELAQQEEGEPKYTRDQMDAFDVVNDELSAIISNINRTIIYFIEQNPLGLGKNIRTIYVSGGTATFDQVRLRLTHEIGAEETILSNPLSKLLAKGMISPAIESQFAARQHEYTLAVGAILGNGGKNNG
jgi:cell division ATPase FtsA